MISSTVQLDDVLTRSLSKAVKNGCAWKFQGFAALLEPLEQGSLAESRWNPLDLQSGRSARRSKRARTAL